MRLSIDIRRRWWWLRFAFHTYMAVFLVGISASLAGHALRRAAGVDWGALLLLTPAALAAGIGLGVLPALACVRLAVSHPSIDVGDDIVISHPGLLRTPLRLARAQVHSVFITRFPAAPPAPAPSALVPSRWDRLRRPGPRPIRPGRAAPDLSLHLVGGSANLLIVLNEPLPCRDLLRRFTGFRNVGNRSGGDSGPTRRTTARALFATVTDDAAAREALGGWPTSPAGIPADVMTWVS